nr:hypothetical protein [uncultured bacterium]
MKKILFFLLLTLQLGVFAQVDTLRGPHGGRIHSYMDYRIEMVGCNDYLEIYLYNKVMDPLNNYGVLGDVKFYYPNEVYSSSPLVPYGADGFTAQDTFADLLQQPSHDELCRAGAYREV